MSSLPPFLTESHLSENMKHPRGPFLVGPRDYFALDGDTILIRGRMTERHRLLHGDKRPEAFRVRHRTIAAPEKPYYNMGERQLLKMGMDAHETHPGIVATKALRDMCRKRVLFIEPSGEVDKYGRMLGDIAVSGAPGPEFEMEGAFSSEREMVRLQVAEPIGSFHDLPPHMPRILEDLLRQARVLMHINRDDPGM